MLAIELRNALLGADLFSARIAANPFVCLLGLLAIDTDVMVRVEHEACCAKACVLKRRRAAAVVLRKRRRIGLQCALLRLQTICSTMLGTRQSLLVKVTSRYVGSECHRLLAAASHRTASWHGSACHMPGQ